MKRETYFLIAILVVAAALRLPFLANGDAISDEVSIAFRAVELSDFDNAAFQTTPLQWLDPNIPKWTKLSFHDHPPLVFWIQHASMRIFGESVFGFRLPSAVLGILSVLLLYLIGARLFSKTAGLLAALMLAVTVNHNYISRVGMQEAYVIFFLLLTLYLFLRGLERPRYFLLAGIAAGLGFLTKYTAFIIVPIVLTYLLIANRRAFRNPYLWIGMALSLLVFTPVIVYNIQLYRTVGHFDFQFSHIFGQNPDVWKTAPGKEIGTVAERLAQFIPRLIKTNSWVFLALAAAAVAAFLARAARQPRSLSRYALLAITIAWLTALILVIGPSFRFLAMLAPFLALAAGALFAHMHERFFRDRPLPALALLAAFLAFELCYTWNNQIAAYPRGPAPWFSSPVRVENYNWGYNELDAFFRGELKGKMPGPVFIKQYEFLRELQRQGLARARAEGRTPYPALILYDDRIFGYAQLWTFDRRLFYEGWPAIPTSYYLNLLTEQGPDFFTGRGFKEGYLVITTPAVPRKTRELENTAPDIVENTLRTRGIAPTVLVNRAGTEAFRIYKFTP